MRLSLFPAALLAALLVGQPARADFAIGARIGDSFIIGGSDGVQAQINLGTKRDRYRKRGYSRPPRANPGLLHSRIGLSRRTREEDHAYDHYRSQPRYLVYPVRKRREVERAEPEPVQPTPKPPAPVKPAEAAEKAPPRPEGHARLLLARGVNRDRVVSVGVPVPDGLPHVTLDPVRFGLPVPPQGQIYARIRGQVYLIEAATRLVLSRHVAE